MRRRRSTPEEFKQAMTTECMDEDSPNSPNLDSPGSTRESSMRLHTFVSDAGAGTASEAGNSEAPPTCGDLGPPVPSPLPPSPRVLRSSTSNLDDPCDSGG